jgi:hypothetical protein
LPRDSEPRNSENPAYSERRRYPQSLATQIQPAIANIHYGYSERQRPLRFTVCRRAVVSAFGNAWGHSPREGHVHTGSQQLLRMHHTPFHCSICHCSQS